MNNLGIKNILYIKNFNKGKKINYLSTYPNIKVNYIESNELVGYLDSDLKKIIEPYDIIIIGGGQQHLVTDDFIITYPEIKNQIEIVKLVSSDYYDSKLLIGICLGCQIIALTYGFKVVPIKKLSIGFDYMDINTLNCDYIKKSNDKYLNKFDFNLLSKSFSFHYDCINLNENNEPNDKSDLSNLPDKLIEIVQSIEKHPYIISNTNKNIYGFQFHPEICLESILCVINSIENIDKNILDFIDIKKIDELEKISSHFFNIFISMI
jgi:GMP synthase-like glutamine amidotransferase